MNEFAKNVLIKFKQTGHVICTANIFLCFTEQFTLFCEIMCPFRTKTKQYLSKYSINSNCKDLSNLNKNIHKHYKLL